MLPPEVRLIAVPGLPEINKGHALGELILAAVQAATIGVRPRDVFVVAQKIVSKAEGQVVELSRVEPSSLARHWAEAHGKDPRMVELILRQSRRILRMDRGRLIVETRNGYVCANAGVDRSNTAPGTATLLPQDCDRSAREICDFLSRQSGHRVAVIISDTFGRAWRLGLVNVALGVAGLNPLLDWRGQRDSFGRELTSTVVARADELASAAGLVMGKNLRLPVAVIRGLPDQAGEGSGSQLLRPAEQDLFR